MTQIMRDYAFIAGKRAVTTNNPSTDDLLRHLRQRLAQKRAAAIAYLGENWVCHPRYVWRERHSNTVAVWQPRRTLKQIEVAATISGRV